MRKKKGLFYNNKCTGPIHKKGKKQVGIALIWSQMPLFLILNENSKNRHRAFWLLMLLWLFGGQTHTNWCCAATQHSSISIVIYPPL